MWSFEIMGVCILNIDSKGGKVAYLNRKKGKKKKEKNEVEWVDVLYALNWKWGGLWEYDRSDMYKGQKKETVGMILR